MDKTRISKMTREQLEELVLGNIQLLDNTAAKISPIVEALGKDIWPCPHTGKTASSLAAILEAIFGHKKPFIKWWALSNDPPKLRNCIVSLFQTFFLVLHPQRYRFLYLAFP